MWQSSGAVRGFAVVLMLGITASMFSALTVTRTVFRWMERAGLQRISMFDLIPKKYFNFVGMRRVALTFSALALVASVAVIAWRGPANLGIDFRGGDLLTVSTTKPLSASDARAALPSNIATSDARVQLERAASAEELERISFRTASGTKEQVLESLETAFPDHGIKSVASDTVGPAIGWEFAKSALFALALSLVAILIYVTIRFEFSFALATVLALMHTVTISLGVFSAIGGELSLVMVGAVLATVGYAINDNIVIFDRIRETLKNNEGGSVASIMNRAINETLGRTILTGGSTLVAVLSLYLFGGTVLRDFAFFMMLGIVVGTYSSLLIAAPIVLWWSKVTGKSIREEIRETEALASRV